MYIVIICNSIKASRNRSKNILDRYSVRIGNNTWSTHITYEGLNFLYKDLRKNASKNTSVSCFINNGNQNLKYLWTVGNNKGYTNNQYRIAYTNSYEDYISNVPKKLRILTLISATAGYAHDIGKASNLFQDKLAGKSKFRKDPIRHEWISKNVLQELRKNKSWDSAWKNAGNTKIDEFFEYGLNSIENVIDFCVATHHGLCWNDNKSVCINNKKHVREDVNYNDIELMPKDSISDKILNNIKNNEKRLSKLYSHDSNFINGAMLICRAMLIMSDHVVSGILVNSSNAGLYANTSGYGTDVRPLNQSLDYHLHNVGKTASHYTYKLFNTSYRGISEQSVNNILKQSNINRFKWQDLACLKLSNVDTNMLILNMAETGSGKTIANVKFCAALNMENDVRITIGLNLKSLTLQTGKSLKTDLKLLDNELSTVIGDKVTQHLFNIENLVDTDENDFESEVLVYNDGIDYNIAEWLIKFCQTNNRNIIVGSPVLVSTIDYVINAGNPNKQGHHVTALLRLSNSDLILDEIDGYDPKALIAVCRIIEISAIFGKNVICSSATLSKHVANVIYKAFNNGNNIRNSILGLNNITNIGFIHNNIDAEIYNIENLKDYEIKYNNYISQIFKNSEVNNFKKATIIDVYDCQDEKDFNNNIIENIKILHEQNSWKLHDKQVSFGMIRVANIKKAIPLSRQIANSLNNVKVCCYHSNDLLIQRYYKELKLDLYLNRKDDSKNIKNDPDIKTIINNSNNDNIIFIVVCTPVEEIGRDHDFDWGIFEPSSIQSIIQSAGRINRHRFKEIENSNISILNYNYRGFNNDNMSFIYPGYEVDTSHPDHDMNSLLPKFKNTLPISSDLRFHNISECNFAKYDDSAINNILQDGEYIFFENENYTKCITGHYDEYSLRGKITKSIQIAIFKDGYKKQILSPNNKIEYQNFNIDIVKKHQNDWLSLSTPELNMICKETDTKIYNGMIVSISGRDDKPNLNVYHDLSFGFNK